MIRLLAAMTIGLVAATPLSACAASSARLVPGQWKTVKAHALTPGAIHEECAKLARGERLEYGFTTDVPVAFNVHYHEGNAVIQPITRDATREERGSFEAPMPQTYCLMWEAGREAAKLDYRVRLLGPRR